MHQEYPSSATTSPDATPTPPVSTEPSDENPHPARPARTKYMLLLVGVVLGVIVIACAGLFYSMQQTNSGVDSITAKNADGLNSTPYTDSKYGISIMLPGSNWGQPNISTSGDGGKYFVRKDSKVHFYYLTYPATETPAQRADEIKMSPAVTSIQSLTNVTFQGKQAVRLELVVRQSNQSLSHDVAYVFDANDVTYAVDAGITANDWDNGGQTTVTSMLDSITIVAPNAVPGITPTPTPKK